MEAPRPTRDFAKALRRKMSLPEVLLWKGLKAGRLDGLHFRKEHPVGPYILDFYCHEVGLAVEVDGQSHGFADNPDRDAARDAWLRSQGVEVLRLRAGYVLESVDGALTTIRMRARGMDG